MVKLTADPYSQMMLPMLVPRPEPQPQPILKQVKKRAPKTKKKSKFLGVSWDTRQDKWLATIRHEGKNVFIGRFCLEEEAAKAINYKCAEMQIPFKNPDVGIAAPGKEKYVRKITKLENRVSQLETENRKLMEVNQRLQTRLFEIEMSAISR